MGQALVICSLDLIPGIAPREAPSGAEPRVRKWYATVLLARPYVRIAWGPNIRGNRLPPGPWFEPIKLGIEGSNLGFENQNLACCLTTPIPNVSVTEA
jgi:hypothetical protein